jgi:hypothetical protein
MEGKYVDSRDEDTVKETCEGDGKVEEREGADRDEGDREAKDCRQRILDNGLKQWAPGTYANDSTLGHCRGIPPLRPS